MLKAFSNHINQHLSFLKDSKLLLAISGGIDSVVLAHLLKEAKLDFALAHCNFKLRNNDSDVDEDFVKKLGKYLNINTHTTRFDTGRFGIENKLSIQMAARKLRYEWFEKLATQYHFDYILTAHHADDNLETFLINLTRGTGLTGLTGIPETNKNIVRPLLPFSREAIVLFAKEKNLEWREDKSNASTKYFRNKIRHQVVPILKELNPKLLESFSNTTEHLQGSKAIIDNNVEKIKSEISTTENEVQKFSITQLKKLTALKAYLFELFHPYGFTEWNDIVNLLDAQSGKYVYSNTYQLLKNRDELILSKRTSVNVDDKVMISVNEHIIQHNEFELSLIKTVNPSLDSTEKHIEFIDTQKLKYPLVVRKWENGDYFYPKGMQGKKKLSKFFKDEKMSLLEKQQTWLLCNANDDIIWIINKRLDDRYKTTDQTKKTLKIEFKK